MKFLIVFCLIAWFGQGLWIILLAAYLADKTTKRFENELKRKIDVLNENLGWR